MQQGYTSHFVELDDINNEDLSFLPTSSPTLIQKIKHKFYYFDWAFWGTILAVLSVTFVGEAARGLVIPSLFLYLQTIGADSSFLSYVVAGFSAGRFIGSLLFGWWYNRRGPREALIVALAISIIGNFMYSFGPLTNKWVVFISRVLVGFGSGTLSPVRATLSDVSTKEQRVRFMAISNATQFIGFAIVPGFATLLTFIDFRVGSLSVDRFTSAGFMLCILNFLSLIAVLICVPSKLVKTVEKKQEEGQLEPARWTNIGIVLFIGLNLVTRGVIALLETVAAPIFIAVWNGNKSNSVQDSSNMFLILGIIGLGMYLIVDLLVKRMTEYVALAVSFAILGTGALLFINYDPDDGAIELWQFIMGSLMIWSISSPLSQTLVLSSFSKLLGNKATGSSMGLIGAAGSIGRIIFPLLSVMGLTKPFVVSCVTSYLACVCIVIYKWKLGQLTLEKENKVVL